MATAPKVLKDKPVSNRLTPRPTAASLARAARNALNRNVTVSPGSKVSPSHSKTTLSPVRTITGHPVSPRQPVKKIKSDIKLDYKTEFDNTKLKHKHNTEENIEVIVYQTPVTDPEKRQHIQENEVPVIEVAKNIPEENESFLIDNHEIKNNSMIVQPEVFYSKLNDENENLGHDHTVHIQEDKPQENDVTFASDEPLSINSKPIRSNCSLSTRSRSRTPSRPTTPSQPPTLKTPSRPLTPSTPTRNSRPSTPKKAVLPATKAQPSSIPIALHTNAGRTQLPPSPAIVVCPTVKEEDDMKAIFNAQLRHYQCMKKELDLKQQEILDLFNNLRKMNEHLVSEGVGSGEGFQFQELVVFNVGDWTSDEVSQLCKDAAPTYYGNNAMNLLGSYKEIDEGVISELASRAIQIPTKFSDLCLQAFVERQELIDWVKDFVGSTEDGPADSIARITLYNKSGLQLCETLRDLKVHADETIASVTKLSRCAIQERSTLLTVGESLVREIASLRKDLQDRPVIINEMKEILPENETAKEIHEMRSLLEEERAGARAAKEKVTTLESQLRQSRIRISKMDRQLRESEASIISLTASVKSLEDQSRQREVQLEARARKLKESVKTGEVTQTQIVRQRDALQAEVQSLKEHLEEITNVSKKTALDMGKEIKLLKASLEEHQLDIEKQTESIKLLEKNIIERESTIEELKAKIPDPNENNIDLPTEREIDLWAELQATKETLRMTEDEVTTCKREKIRFLETLTKISESEDKISMHQKLAGELLNKEEIIGKMQIQIRELMKNFKLNEQKVMQYEQYVHDLQAYKLAAVNCHDSPNGLNYQDLQQEIMNLKMKLLDAVHRNEELSELVSQKDQQIEQQDKTSRAQARIIKVREELINMLKNKETAQSKELSNLQQDLEQRMKIVDEVNKQIAAKADEIQELFVTLENKQQQIHRLEKIVLALEEQQRRSQAQRTRHEEKIAALEHELTSGIRRERKFFFF